MDTMGRQSLTECVESGQIPKMLFKHRDAGDLTLSILADLELWFAAPASFNDPFDCNLSEVDQHSSSGIVTYLQSLGFGERRHAIVKECEKKN